MKQILITGSGGSASKAISKVFKRANLEFGHEELKRHGMASWWVAAGDTGGDRPRGYGKRRGPILADFRQPPLIYHQVRYPLHSISTAQRYQEEAWRWATKFEPKIGDPATPRACMRNIHACMKYWYYWNLKAEALAEWTYPIEGLELLWGDWCKRVLRPEWAGIYDKLANDNKLTNSHRTWYQSLTWKDLHDTDDELAWRIRELGVRYGYNTATIEASTPDPDYGLRILRNDVDLRSALSGGCPRRA